MNKKTLSALIAGLVILLGLFLAKPLSDRFAPVETTTELIYTGTLPDEGETETETTTEYTISHYTYNNNISPQPTTQRAAKSTTKKETQASSGIREDGSYYSKNDVALYIHTYGHLPSNFITKKQAQALGWSGGSVEVYAPGKAIGGDYYGNYEGELPSGSYHECDINTNGRRSRSAERIVYSSDGRVYYTADHYEIFTQLY